METKLSDVQFLSILRANGGLFSRTARAIEEKYKVTFSRQAVRERALKHPKELQDIEEEIIDVAEEGLQGMIRGSDNRVKLRAIELFLKTKGYKRGYVESKHLDITTGGEPIKSEPVQINFVKTKEEED